MNHLKKYSNHAILFITSACLVSTNFCMEQPTINQPIKTVYSLEEVQKKLIEDYNKALSIAELIRFDKPESNIFNLYISLFNELKPKKRIQQILADKGLVNNNFLWLYILISGLRELERPNLTAGHLYRIAYTLVEFLGEIGSKQQITYLSSSEINQLPLTKLAQVVQIIDTELDEFEINVGVGICKPLSKSTKFTDLLKKLSGLSFFYETE